MKTSNRNPVQRTPLEEKREKKIKDYPENQIGFPERNDASDPNVERERVHVDLETLDISRKSAEELDKEVKGK